MPLAVEQIRRMRGGAQAHLMRCADEEYYVVKFQNNPQGVRILANELLATRLAARIGAVSYTHLRGMKTLEVRMEKQCRNAMIVAKFLEKHPKVSAVHYPGLPSHPDHKLAKRQMRGFGAMLAFDMKGGLAAARRFCDRARIFLLAASLGGVESLVVLPIYTCLLYTSHKILEEDLALRFARDPQTKEFLLSGAGQQHVEVVVAKLHKRYHVDLTLKPPKVPYRETIRGKADAEGKHKKQTGGHGQFGVCRIKMEPLPRGGGFEFVDDVFGGAIPKNWIPSVEKGIRDSAERGFLAGFPVCLLYTSRCV